MFILMNFPIWKERRDTYYGVSLYGLRRITKHLKDLNPKFVVDFVALQMPAQL
jgi:hypothetical protein